MNSEVISFFYDFNCIADKCRNNCCKAWNLIIDEETATKYRDMPGSEGKKLRSKMKKSGDGTYCLSAPFGKCCFQDKNGLCSMQCEGKGELLPKVCRLFPRYTVSYGGCEIGVIDLACETAAQLFLKQEGRLEFIPSKEPLDIYWEVKEADAPFAETLKKDLELILDRLWNDTGKLWKAQRDILTHIYSEHLLLVRNEFLEPGKIPFDTGFLEERFAEELPWIIKERYKEVYDDLPLIPVSFINEIIYAEFSDWYLITCHPGSYKLIRAYKKRFGKLYEKEADEFFNDKLTGLFEKYTWLEDKLKSYFSYKLQMIYIGASIDYYLLEPVFMALVSEAFLMIFIVTAAESGDELTLDRLSELISENDRLFWHNVSFRDRVMQRVRDKLF